MPDPLQELLAAGAVPTTTFPPTSRYANVGVDAWDPGGGAAAGAVPAPPVLPAPGALRAAVRGADRRGRPARRARVRATSATRSCGGASPTRTASSIRAT